MSGTNFSVTNQHDLIAAAAAVYAISQTVPAAYTITLANDVVLAGSVTLKDPAAGSTLSIVGAGHALTGPGNLTLGGPWAGGGAGTVILDGANSFTGGLFVANGTLELARPDAAGIGLLSLFGGYNEGAPVTLVVDGPVPPSNPIALGVGNTLFSPYLLVTIDLKGIATTARAATLDSGLGITFPATGGGTVLLEFDANAGDGAVKFLLTPDGNGGTRITETLAPISDGVTVRGAAGSVFTVPFNDPTAGPVAQPLADPLNAAVLGGTAIPFPANPGDALPALGGGQTLEVIALAAGAYALPANAPAALVSTVAGAVSVAGGDADGQLVLVGTGGLVFTAGTGAGTVIAGGGANLVSITSATGSQYVLLGDGDDTVTARHGVNTIDAGRGANLIRLGADYDHVFFRGADTIVAGSGNATIGPGPGAAGAGALEFLGPGASTVVGGGGADTIVGNRGIDEIATGSRGTSLVFLNQNQADLTLFGSADTVVGGTGAATINGNTGGALVFGGAGRTVFTGGNQGTDTIVASPGGTMAIGLASHPFAGTSNVVAFAYGPLTFDGRASFGAATVVSAGTALAVTMPGGGGAALGGSAGGNVLDARAALSSTTTMLVAGGDGDTLAAGSGATYINAGTGAETVIGSVQQFPSGLTLLTLVQGNATDLLFQNFDPRIDYFSLSGVPAGEAAAALAGATTAGGSELLTLSDGTHITFEGVTGLTAANFL